MKPSLKRFALAAVLLMPLDACHPVPDFTYNRAGVSLCTLSVNAGALVYGHVRGWGASYIDNAGMSRTPVQVRLDKVVRGPVNRAEITVDMRGKFQQATGALTIDHDPAGRAVLAQGSKKTEGYLFLWKGNLSLVEGAGYLWLEPDGLYHSGSTYDGLVNGVPAQRILDADSADSGKTRCGQLPAPAVPGAVPPDGGTAGDAGFRPPRGDAGP